MIKPPLVTFCSILGLFTVGSTFAGTAPSSAPSSVQGVAEREIVRRQDAMLRAHESMVAGDVAMRQKDYDMAVEQYRAAVNFLPECPSTHKLRSEAVDGFCEASVQLAKQRIAEGRFADAEAVAKSVLDDRYDPHCGAALTLLDHLREPDYYNKTVTPKFRANVDQVNQWMVDANGFYATGRYDLAFKRYEQVLNVDPYNIAAQKGKEKVDQARENYNNSAYNEARARAITQVGKEWEMPIRKYGSGPNTVVDQGPQSPNNTAQISAKLARIIIPKVEFREATVRETIEFLKDKSRLLDVTETDSSRKGVNIVLQMDAPGASAAPAAAAPAAPAADAATGIPGLDAAAPAPAATAGASGLGMPTINPNEARITLSLTNVPQVEVLRYVVNLAGLKIKIDPYAVAIVPVTTVTEQLITKEYKVSPGFLSNKPSGGASSALSTSPTASSSASSNSSGMTTKVTARDFLEASGVQFPPGASANFLASSSKLIVRNTQDQLDMIETIVDADNGAVPKQVEIEAKFIEISQNNLKELSFDWLLGQFNIGSSERVFSSGGTPGTGNGVNSVDYPFVAPNGSIVGQNPVTSGNRTGSGLGGAISANAIDALLFPATAGASSAAPGILGIAGVFTDPQFQVVIRALNQKKGVDLLSAPRVTTKSGQRASIEIIREFRYPTEFNPPQIPQTVTASTGGGGVGGGSVGALPITPTTPTTFETRNTGVSLEVEPVVGPDGSTIDLNLVPSVVEFEGFINYGSPILSPGSASFLNTLTGVFTAATPDTVVTPNVINQPIFSQRKITTSVSIWDGQTVVLGGMIREDVQKVEDKVPLLGDLPLIGRAFRSSVDQHLKKNLMVFVTARLINPAGEPVNQDEEKEEVVESLTPGALPEAPALPK